MAKTSEATRARPVTEAGKILVGFDGGEGGDDALAAARLLAAVEGRSCESLTQPVDLHSPARALIDAAKRQRAGTVAVGAPHRGRLGRALLGSVARHVLHHAPCEVMVAPHGYAREPHERIERIAVAYDGAEESKLALKRAELVARKAGASIEVVVAEDPVVVGLEVEHSLDDDKPSPDVLEEALRSVDPSLHCSGQRIDPGWRKVVRTIAAAIAVASEQVGADLLVAGSRRPVDRFMLGSVTNNLIDVSPCPVLVVPRPE